MRSCPTRQPASACRPAIGRMRLDVHSWVRILISFVLSFELALYAAAVHAEDSTLNGSPANSAREEEAPAKSLTYMGRRIAPTMSYSGAGWLTRVSRAREESPEKLLKALGLKPGQTVCDFGCGNGYYTIRLAKRLGPLGTVYAVDIQQEMLELLGNSVKPRGLKNVKPVLATKDDPGLPPATFDMVLMVDVYHELSDPAGVLAVVRKSLKPEGRLVLVEFREEDPAVPILSLHKMSQGQVLKEITANKFKLIGQFDKLPWQHVLEFARDDSPLEAAELKPWKRPKQAD